MTPQLCLLSVTFAMLSRKDRSHKPFKGNGCPFGLWTFVGCAWLPFYCWLEVSATLEVLGCSQQVSVHKEMCLSQGASFVSCMAGVWVSHRNKCVCACCWQTPADTCLLVLVPHLSDVIKTGHCQIVSACSLNIMITIFLQRSSWSFARFTCDNLIMRASALRPVDETLCASCC